MPLCRNCERGVVQPHAVYCCRKCTIATLGDARWRPLPPTTHALQRGEQAMLYFPGQDGGPSPEVACALAAALSRLLRQGLQDAKAADAARCRPLHRAALRLPGRPLRHGLRDARAADAARSRPLHRAALRLPGRRLRQGLQVAKSPDEARCRPLHHKEGESLRLDYTSIYRCKLKWLRRTRES
jgi:hypothetical protein